jgi:hypothetical protein
VLLCANQSAVVIAVFMSVAHAMNLIYSLLGFARARQSRLLPRTVAIVVVNLFLIRAPSAGAQKTDSVWIRNGDRITGEVKSLSRGLLKYSTNDLGTISIEWDKVDRISSTTIVEVRMGSGEKFFGHLGLAPSGRLLVGTDTLRLADIVKMTPIKSKFLTRLDGYLDIGLSYQKAHSAFQLSTGGRVQYRGPKAETVVELTTYREGRDDAAQTSRLTTAVTERIFISNLWSTGVVVGFDQNKELDLAGRVRLVGFGTRTFVQTNRIEFLGSSGLVLTRERYVSTPGTTKGVEGMLFASFRAFRYDSPKLDASLVSQAYPSFSIKGRWRLQNDARLSYELLSDFMLTGTLFDTYDSKPQGTAASKHDFGTTLGISWSY